jgi:hypothetical protein
MLIFGDLKVLPVFHERLLLRVLREQKQKPIHLRSWTCSSGRIEIIVASTRHPPIGLLPNDLTALTVFGGLVEGAKAKNRHQLLVMFHVLCPVCGFYCYLCPLLG